MGYSIQSGQHKGHTLWSRDESTYRALATIGYHRKGWRPEVGQRFAAPYGRTVTVAGPKLPYGRATAKPHIDRTVTHVAHRVLLAWMGGRLLGSMALWLCGSTTTDPVFEPEVLSRPCPICFLRLAGPPVVITNSLVVIGGH